MKKCLSEMYQFELADPVLLVQRPLDKYDTVCRVFWMKEEIFLCLVA